MLSRVVIFLTSISLTMGCGSFNVNQFLESEERQNALDALLYDAQSEYDRGNYKAALKKAKKAKAIRPDAEHATVLIGYIHLGLAGLDIFSLAKGMAKKDDDDPDQDKTAQTFAKLSAAIGLGEVDLLEMSEEYLEEDGEDPMRIYLPNPTAEARASTSFVMENIDAAVRALCPFIGTQAKLIDPTESAFDERHECDLIELATNEKRAQALFAWAIAHLGEAVSFYSLIFYQDPGKSDSNIIRRTQNLQEYTNQPVVYLERISALADLIERIFPVDPQTADGSMLNAMFDNLEVTSRSFAAIAGLPDSFSESISKALQNVKDKLPNQQTATPADNNKALKDSLTKSLSRRLSSQIEELPVDQRSEACDAFARINSDAPRPEGC